MQPIAELRNISKRYPGVQALDNVTVGFFPGEVHALLGENGAGKSTLINIIAGLQKPTSGEYVLNGQDGSNLSPADLRMFGVSSVFQEFSLAPDLSVTENLFLGRETKRFGILQHRLMRQAAKDILSSLSFVVDPSTVVGDLPRSARQMVEIAKALLILPKVLILDEPTASLTDYEAAKLFETVERLRVRGVAIIYVSHRMDELRRLADRITVLRDGRHVFTRSMAGISDSELVQGMTGREVGTLFPDKPEPAREILLRASGIQTACGAVVATDLKVRAGEIVGIAGLVGCGKSELGRALFGLEPLAAGQIEFRGRSHEKPTPRNMIRSGLCYFPADRGRDGLAATRSVRDNMTMAALRHRSVSRSAVLRLKSERTLAGKIADTLRLRPRNIEAIAGALSGGNKQKVVIGRALTRDFNVLIFDEPTVGVDVGARFEIYRVIVDFAARGAGVILISSDNNEIVHLSNRVYVMHAGRPVRELRGDSISDANILGSIFQISSQVGAQI
ncbi:hypothetical protein ASD00_31265 [Ensifer sp. Root31]|uniref:sugar ABC transporter ATP-binding protein n=1 Tax=Ensifer sp. Root31 TaxID=1736512 RepID=UPI000709D516|nr:sugar ABC transporter ATP-binding protein [Ensifer sp. Root31]KQU86372.1 hypothetical protein ASD00_31265 [Ensifer sp. Root31]